MFKSILPGGLRELRWCCVLILSVLGSAVGVLAQEEFSCGDSIVGTFENFSKGNQSKSFYHGNKWWQIAPAKADKKWYLWKFNGTAWIKGIEISDAPKDRPDTWRQSAQNKLYVLLPGGNTTRLSRLTYSGGNWTVDNGYPKHVNDVQEDVMNLVRANNGSLWVFWIADSTLRGQRSSDEGNTWSQVIDIKRPLNEEQGLTDAVALKIGGVFAIGLGYAEDSGTPNSRFGFLYHKDSAGDTVWVDETSKLPGLINTTADDHLSMATYKNQIFMIIKTKGGGAGTLKNGLYHRKGTTWSLYPIINGNGWTRPVISIDITNSVLYVLGAREGTSRNVEMKYVNWDNYGDLFDAPVDTVLCDTTDNFFDVTMPSHNISSATGLMVIANNQNDNNLWYRRLPVGALVPKFTPEGDPDEEEAIAGVIDDFKLAAEVYPNPFNPSTTISFRLRTAAPVKLQIFNVSGQLVRTLFDGELPAGEHQRHWNARNHNGEPVASGTYIYRLHAGGRLATGQMQLLK